MSLGVMGVVLASFLTVVIPPLFAAEVGIRWLYSLAARPGGE